MLGPGASDKTVKRETSAYSTVPDIDLLITMLAAPYMNQFPGSLAVIPDEECNIPGSYRSIMLGPSREDLVETNLRVPTLILGYCWRVFLATSDFSCPWPYQLLRQGGHGGLRMCRRGRRVACICIGGHWRGRGEFETTSWRGFAPERCECSVKKKKGNDARWVAGEVVRKKNLTTVPHSFPNHLPPPPTPVSSLLAHSMTKAVFNGVIAVLFALQAQ